MPRVGFSAGVLPPPEATVVFSLGASRVRPMLHSAPSEGSARHPARSLRGIPRRRSSRGVRLPPITAFPTFSFEHGHLGP